MQFQVSLPDYYAILGVDRAASAEEVIAAYRRQVRLYHPDLNPEIDESRIREVNQAYEVLGEPTHRAEYDRELARQEWLGAARSSVRTRFGYAQPEWSARPHYASTWGEYPSLLAELMLALEALVEASELAWQRSLIWEFERAFGVDSPRTRRPPR